MRFGLDVLEIVEKIWIEVLGTLKQVHLLPPKQKSTSP